MNVFSVGIGYLSADSGSISKRLLIAMAVWVAALAAWPVAGMSRSEIERGPVRLEGVLNVARGDAQKDRTEGPVERFFLDMEGGAAVELELSPEMISMAGGTRRLGGSRVEVVLEAGAVGAKTLAEPRKAVVRSLRVLGRPLSKGAEKAVTGSQPWVSILCKFSDVSAEPKTLSYFLGMYGSSYPGLDHYWRQLSYDKVNVSGSTAVAWVTLPHPVGHYYSSSGGDTTALLNDCTAAADAYVYYPDFVGINMMFNADFGPYAWGGFRTTRLDNVWRTWRVTWEPPWGYRNVGIIAHEMGHGFGLPHSNNADGDGSPYDNPWDVMSDSWHYALYDSTYGTVGKGTIGYHLDILGWIDSERKVEIDAPGIYTVSLDHLALQSTSNSRLINIDIPGTARWYTVEVRDRAGYDGNLPGFAVVIHEVDPYREEEAWLVDVENPGNGADEGAMWTTGECFEDGDAQIRVCVQSVTTEGYLVRVEYGDTQVVFDDGFESGGFGTWSSVSQ